MSHAICLFWKGHRILLSNKVDLLTCSINVSESPLKFLYHCFSLVLHCKSLFVTACQQQWHSSTGVIVTFVLHVHDAVTSELQEHIHLQDVDFTVDFYINLSVT